MNSLTKRAFTSASIVFLAINTTMQASVSWGPWWEMPGHPVLERHIGQTPEPGTESSKVQGEVIYREFEYPAVLSVTPGKDIVLKNQRVAAGTSIFVIPWDKGVRCCLKGTERYPCTAHPSGCTAVTCFFDNDRDGFLEKAMSPRGMLSAKKIKVPYTVDTIAAKPRDVSDWSSNFFQREIVYQGSAGGVLRLLYREYLDSLAREAFSQELTYELSADDPTVVSVKSARIQVLSAGNEGISYKIIRGF